MNESILTCKCDHGPATACQMSVIYGATTIAGGVLRDAPEPRKCPCHCHRIAELEALVGDVQALGDALHQANLKLNALATKARKAKR